MEPSNLQVVLMGMITVFICLCILIGIIYLMGAVMRHFNGKTSVKEAASAMSETNDMATDSEKQAVIAAISAAIAEDSGADISRIRIHSIKRL